MEELGKGCLMIRMGVCVCVCVCVCVSVCVCACSCAILVEGTEMVQEIALS